MADITGLKLTEKMVNDSAVLHNQLPPDDPFPQLDLRCEGVIKVCALIAEYNVQTYFQLRLLHRHMIIPDEHILLGSRVNDPPGYWTRPVHTSNVSRHEIHPHIISMPTLGHPTEDTKKRNTNLFPSEFRDDPPGRIPPNQSAFFLDFCNCLWTHGLQGTLGLEVIQGETERMIEFSFNSGSLLLREENVNMEAGGPFNLQETSWTITVKNGTVLKTGETRCITLQIGHTKVTDTKINSASDALNLLRSEGYYRP